MTIRTRWLPAVILAFLTVTGPVANAAGLLGVTYLGDQLISVDPSTGTGSLVGSFPSSLSGFGLADANNKLYTFDSNSDVIRQIDPTNANILATYNIGLAPGALAGQGGLAFQSGTVGFLTSSLDPTTTNPVNSLYRFDLSTGTSVNLVPNGGTSDALEALAFSPGGTLYGLGKGDGNLYSVNTSTGALSLIGNVGLGVGSPIGGLGFGPNGSLYATLDDSLYSLSTVTGLATPVSTNPATGFSSISGLAAAPTPDSTSVPEPSSLAIFGTIAALAFGGREVRRRKAARA